MQDRADAEALLVRYIAACEALDVEGIVRSFAHRANVIDPTSPRMKGRRKIMAYFMSPYGDLSALRLTTSPLSRQGAEFACRWQGVARRKGGKVIAYEGTDVFRLTAKPAISRMQAFWEPKDFVPADTTS